MSLINDALKRARQARPPAPPGGEPDPPLQPAEGSRGGSLTRVLAMIASVVAVFVAGWFLWQWWQSPAALPKSSATMAGTTNKVDVVRKLESVQTKTAVPSTQAVAAAPAPVVTNAEATSEVVSSLPEIQPVGGTSQPPAAAEIAPVSTPVISDSAGAEKKEMAAAQPTLDPGITNKTEELLAPARPAVFPQLKLQGVYFRMSKPSVLINNRTLFIGDQIEGARVVSIQRYSVKFEMGGQVKELSLR